MPIDALKMAGKVLGGIKDHFEDKGQLKIIEAELASKLETEMIERDQLQAKINLADAKARSFFQSGWRPMVGWICALGLFYGTFGLHMGNFLIGAVNGYMDTPLPVLPYVPTEGLITMLCGMLGFAGMRTAEKFGGIDGGRLGKK